MKAQQLAVDTLAREKRKAELIAAERDAWEAKLRLVEIKRKFPTVALKPDEEEMLFRTGVGSSKKQKLETSSQEPAAAKVPKAARKAAKGDSATGSPAPGLEASKDRIDTERHMPVEALRERTAAMAMQIEREVARKREGDYQWEDYTDVSVLLLVPALNILTFSSNRKDRLARDR